MDKYSAMRASIKENSELSERLQKALSFDGSVASRVQRRNNLIDEMYDYFNQYGNQETRIHVNDFKKYEILFSQELREKHLNKKLSSEETEMIANLSAEFYSLVNTQKPIHIVDDDGNDVIPPLPPIYMRLNTLCGAGNEAIDIFNNAYNNDDGVPGGVRDLMKSKAMANLSIILKTSQDQESIMSNIAEFDELAENFHKEVLGKSVFNPDQPVENEQKADTKDQPAKSTKQVSQPEDEFLFDFEPM